MDLLTLDVETTLNGPEHDKGNPCFPNNHVVLLGALSHGLYSSYNSMDAFNSVLPTQVDFVVGCNIAFDLLYLYYIIYYNGSQKENFYSCKRI